MPKVPDSVVKEQYLLKSTFFYNKLTSGEYFDLFMQIQKFAQIEGHLLSWNSREEWSISKNAWKVISDNNISPALVFLHPKTLTLHPKFLKYYRSVAMIPQKALKTLSHISNVDSIEDGKFEPGSLSLTTINKLVCAINEIMSLVIELSSELNENKLQGMMYATAGTNIDGSWRNQIGAEGERVIRSIIFKELLSHNEVLSISERSGQIYNINECNTQSYINNIDSVRTITLINGFSILFASEPDVTMYDTEGNIVGIIEIKSGLDPAGALERLGAMFKSFENTLAEFPNCVTILVASCITDEVETRLSSSMVIRQKYITTNITANDSEKRKFVNRLRVIMKLISKTM